MFVNAALVVISLLMEFHVTGEAKNNIDIDVCFNSCCNNFLICYCKSEFGVYLANAYGVFLITYGQLDYLKARRSK